MFEPLNGGCQMINFVRRAVLAGAVTLTAAWTAGAQQIVTFGSAEAGGAGSSLFLLGASASSGNVGWSPVVSLEAYRLNYRSGPGTTTSNNVFSPSVGMKYQTTTGATQGRIGYAFVSSSTEQPVTVGAFPIPASSKNGVFVSAQHDYWGTGEHTAQLLGSYNFGNEFLWTRGRIAQRMGGVDSPVMLGAEAGFLGGGENTKTWGFFVGPTLGYRATQALRFTAAAGYRASTSASGNGTGYAKLDFVYILPKM